MKRKPGVKPIELDKDVLDAAYVQTQSVRKTAAILGVSRMTIQRRLEQAEVVKTSYVSSNVGRRTQKPAHSEIQASLNPTKKCEVCELRAYGKNRFCPKHQQRFDRHGDPGITLRQRGKV